MDKETYYNLLDLAKFKDQGDEFYEKLVDCMDVLKSIEDFDETGEKDVQCQPG